MFDDRVMVEELENYMNGELKISRRDYILGTLLLGIKQDGFEGLTVPEATFMAYCFYHIVLDWWRYKDDKKMALFNMSRIDKAELDSYKRHMRDLIDIIIRTFRTKTNSYNSFDYDIMDKTTCVDQLKRMIETYTEAKRFLVGLGYKEKDLESIDGYSFIVV